MPDLIKRYTILSYYLTIAKPSTDDNVSIQAGSARDNPRLIDGLLVLTMFIWGSNFVLLKTVMEYLSPFTVNAIRFGVGAIGVGLIAHYNGYTLRLARHEWPLIIYSAIIGNLIYQAVFLIGLQNTKAGNSALLLTAAPLIVVFYNVWRGIEHITRRGLMGAVLAVMGVAVVIISRYAGHTTEGLTFGGKTLLGDVITIGSAFIWAWSVQVSRLPLQHTKPLVYSFWVVLWGALFQCILVILELVHIIPTLASSSSWAQVPTLAFLLTALSGVLSVATGGSIWNYAMSKIGPARTSVFNNLQPIVTTVVAAIVLHETLTIWIVVGTTLVLYGMWQVRRGYR